MTNTFSWGCKVCESHLIGRPLPRKVVVIGFEHRPTCMLAGSAHPGLDAGPDSSRSHVADWGCAPWRHAHPRASVDLLRPRTGAQLRAGPNAQQRLHRTSPEAAASPPYELPPSCKTAYIPGCPKRSWSRRSSCDLPEDHLLETRKTL